MPRGGSRGGSRSPPPRSTTTATRPMPQQQTSVPQQQTRSGGLLSGIGSTIMQGMAFGAGSEVAHQAVRGVMGGNSHQQVQEQQPQQYQQQQVQQNPCQQEITNFSQCIQRNDDLSYCQPFSDMLKSCKQSNGIAWFIHSIISDHFKLEYGISEEVLGL